MTLGNTPNRPMVCSNTNKWRKWKRLTALQWGIGDSLPAASSSTSLRHDLGNLVVFEQSETNDYSWFALRELTTTQTRLEAPRREIPMCHGKPYPGLLLLCLPQTLTASVSLLHPNWRESWVQNWEMQLAFATWQWSHEPWGYPKSPVSPWPGKWKLQECFPLWHRN